MKHIFLLFFLTGLAMSGSAQSVQADDSFVQKHPAVVKRMIHVENISQYSLTRMRTKITDYDAQGKEILKVSYYEDIPIDSTSYEYDERGLLICITNHYCFDESNVDTTGYFPISPYHVTTPETYRTVLTYDEQGRKLSLVWDESVSEFYSYNKKGYLSTCILRYSFGKPGKIVYTYDKKGNRISKKIYDNGKLQGKDVYTYDERGNMLSESHYDPRKLEYKCERTYDERNNKLTESYYEWQEEGWWYFDGTESKESKREKTFSVGKSNTYVNTYDEQGNLIKVEIYAASLSRHPGDLTETYEYEYY